MNDELLRAAVKWAEESVKLLHANLHEQPRDVLWRAFCMNGLTYLTLRQTNPAPEVPDPRALAVAELEALADDYEGYAVGEVFSDDEKGVYACEAEDIRKRIARLKEPA